MERAKCLGHAFEDYERRAVGCWEKRMGGGDAIYVAGVVQICRACGMMRLLPDNSWIRPVEVEPSRLSA